MAHSLERIPNTPCITFLLRCYEDPSYFPYPNVSKFCPNSFPDCLEPSPHYYFWCLVSLTQCGIVRHLKCYFTWWYYGSIHVEPWHFSTKTTLLYVFMQQSVKFAEVWYIMWLFAGTLICYYTYSHKHKDTQHTRGLIDRHNHTNISSHYLPFVHNLLPVLHGIIHWYQKFTFRNVFFFFSKITHLQKSCICWLAAIRLSSFCEIQITLMETV